MKEDRERQSSWSVAAILLTIALLLPVLYLISSGPVEWLMSRGYVSYDNPFVKAFYYPGEFLMRNCQPLNDFVRWYLALWK